MTKYFKSTCIFGLCLAFGLISCETETEEVTPDNDTNVEAVVGDSFDIINSQESNREVVTNEAILNLVRNELQIDAGIITKGEFVFPDGSSEERFWIGDDITMTAEALRELQAQDHQADSRQYRTFNLVTGSNRTVDIIGYTGGQFALSNKARTALQWAVNNFNRISGSTLRFRLTFGTNYGSQDMVVYDNSVNNAGGGGVAGFPDSAGRPNKFVQIYNIEQFSTNVNEHVITHEIGHSIGFRHTDYFDRLSCPASSQGNEGSGSDGAINIPGTPTGRDVTSVMQACFSTTEDGEFNGNDITAIQFMY